MMAIGSVVERANSLIVYDERGHQTATIPLGIRDARLQGYTATVVSVRRGNVVPTYDERGRQIGMVPAGR